MKRILSLIIAVMMVISLLPIGVFAITEEDYLKSAQESALVSLENYENLTAEQKEGFKTRISSAQNADDVSAIMSEALELNIKQGTEEYKQKEDEKNKLPAAKDRLNRAISMLEYTLSEIKVGGKYEKADLNLQKKIGPAIEEAKKWVDSDLLTVAKADELSKELEELFREVVASASKEQAPDPKPEVKPNPDPTPTGEYVTLTVYRNSSSGDYEFTTKSYVKGTYLYNVSPFSRIYYRLNGYSYSRNGSIINEYTKVEDLAIKTIYADWTYVGDSYYEYDYYRYNYRPNSLIYTMDKAKAFKKDYPFQIANGSSALKAEFDSAYNVVSEMYDNSYWRYPNNGRVYYRNGAWYTYNEYVSRYGTYDMESYRRYGYDGYYSDLYERNGRIYSYNEYYNVFGRYPYNSERIERSNRRYWDAYYGWTGYDYGYYNGNYKAKLERLIDAIRAIARQYPNHPIYSDYANLAYPSYANDYYDYDYYGYTGKASELRKLVEKAESLRDRIKGYTTYEILNNLQACIDDAYRALQGRANYAGAYSNLEAAMKRADVTDDTIYIRRAYMQGSPDGNFGPYQTLTRAQVAQIVANLLKQSGKTTVYNPKQYKDVQDYRWFKEAVDLVTSYGIMTGTPGGLFEPNKLVTKAELVVIAARLKNYQPSAGNVFNLKTHYWAQGYIQTAVKNGWIDAKKGFVPDAPITRGETVHVFNGSLGYGPDEDYIIKYGNEMKKFNDVKRGVDYYYDIMTATNTISYKNTLTGRLWLSHIRPEGMWTFNQFSQGHTVLPLN